MKLLIVWMSLGFSLSSIAAENAKIHLYRLPASAKNKISRGIIAGFKAQDAGSLEVMRTTIEGNIAKKIFDHLAVASFVLSGQDGEQTTKEAAGVTCGHYNGKNYFCAVDFSAKGVGQ